MKPIVIDASMAAAWALDDELDDDEWIVSFALQHDLSAYDAAYLALTMQTQAVLATNDRKLARAAVASGVGLRTVLDNT